MTSASSRRTRVSFARLLLVLTAAAVVGWFLVRTITAAVAGPETPGPATFTGYVDVTATPSYGFETPAGAPESDVTLSFIVADPTEPCEPSWGGYYSLDAAADELEIDRRIVQLRSVGGHVRVSFGGQANSELALACDDQEALVDAYREVVDRYELDSIDLDVEGPAIDDAPSIERRAAAIATLQAERPDDDPLAVWLTLPIAEYGLTPAGEQVVDATLQGGVDLAGVNGMAMNFNTETSAAGPQADAILDAGSALQEQVVRLYGAHGQDLDGVEAWSRTGLTVMIGQNDVAAERFTLADADVVNQFALDRGLGLLSMWSLNRDATCTAPLPTVTTVVQTSCSGIDQQGMSFAAALAEDLPLRVIATPRATGSPEPSAAPSQTEGSGDPREVEDDPETSPYPIWDPLGTYPAGTKIVWQRQVYEARWWTSGVAPGSAPLSADDPWTLVGPVLPGDKPAPLPTLPAGTYPEWDPEQTYTAGDRVLLDQVPYEAKWWSEGTEPGTHVAGGSPWVLILPAQ